MASREEEKRLRREEREKAERAAAAEQARGKRLRALLAGLVAIAVVVGVVLAVSGGGDDDMGSTGDPTAATGDAAIPPVKERNLEKAAEAANCELASPEIEGSTHVEGKVEYKTNPPTSGDHNGNAALDGIYEAGNEPEPENYVHSLEHGRILVHYKAGSPAKTVAQLETLVSEELNGIPGYKMLLLQNNTNMDAAVVATAWGQSLTCARTSDAMFDALRAFRTEYTDKGPENVPPTTG